MLKEKSFKVSSAALAAFIMLFLFAATSQAALYRFDDVSGTNVAGAQWVVVSDDLNSVGASTATQLNIRASLINNRDHAYVGGGRTAVRSIFLVLPSYGGNLDISLGGLGLPGDENLLHDVTLDLRSYNVNKQQLAPDSWRFALTKASAVGRRSTEHGALILTQRTAGDTPSQTLQVPIVVADVFDGSAAGEKLRFRATLRETFSGAVTAHDSFSWDAGSDISVGGNAADWVFVPVDSLPIDSNTVNYRLSLEVTNYSGLRYALQRYDASPMNPVRWEADLQSYSHLSQLVPLQELSHISPGLITKYDRTFNAISGADALMDAYPVDPSTIYHRLSLSHPSIFGLFLGMESGSDFNVLAFRLLASDINFLSNLATVLKSPGLTMPEKQELEMAGAVSHDYLFGDAINTIRIKMPVPVSTDVYSHGLLPLHITLNIPRSNRYLSPLWDQFVTVARDQGDLRSLFATYFSVYSRDSIGTNVDLISWLKGSGNYERVFKTLLDEEREVLTVNFIVLLTDIGEGNLRVVTDKSAGGEVTYLVMRDGYNDREWNALFFTAPAGANAGATQGSSEGGGCSAGIFPALSLLCLSLALLKKRR